MINSTGYQLRLKDWQALQNSEHGPDWDAVPWATQCYELIEDFKALLTGSPAAPATYVKDDWEGIRIFRELAFYGRYGAFLAPRTPAEGKKWLSQAVPRAQGLIELAPGRALNYIPEAIHACSKGRVQLECGAGFIDQHAVALLAGVSTGRVRNLTFGANAIFTLTDGQIPVEQAAAWLKTRPGFWASIWQEDSREDGVVTVPEASDGTVFHPGLRRRNGYTIGEKGSEVTVETYDEALAELTRMKEPRWRRPNKEGNWGIVKAVSWVEWKRNELNQLRA